jgi:hypothetical protein
VAPGRGWPQVPPFRGDQVAAGVVVATALVVLLELRMDWTPGAHLAFAGCGALGAGVLVAGCPREPRPYVSAIVTSALILAALALARLGEVLGADGLIGGAGALTWRLVVLGLLAAFLARAYDAAAATLVGALALAFVPVVFASWLGDPSDGVVKVLLLLAALGLALLTVTRRDRHPAHAAQLANAAGIALVALGATPLAQVLLGSSLGLVDDGDAAYAGAASVAFFGIGWGWEVPLVVGGFGLLAYGAVDRQRGPVLVGLLVLATFVASAASEGRGSLLGWPIVLAVGAAFMLVIGLRPTTPAPPEPLGDDGPELEPLPLRPRGR